MIEKGSWPHRVKNSKHGSGITYGFRVSTGIEHVNPAAAMYQQTHGNPGTLEAHQQRLNEMRRWCREHVGEEIIDFNSRAMRCAPPPRDPKTVCFLFMRENDAFAFMLRWKLTR